MRPSTSDRLPGGWMAWVGPALIAGAVSIYIAGHWDRIPDRYPIHWSLGGVPNGWAMRTPLGVYQLILTGEILHLVCLSVAWQITKQASGSPEMRRFTAHTLLGAAYLLAVCFCSITYQLVITGGEPGALLMIFVGGSIVIFTGAAWYFGRRVMNRAGRSAASPAGSVGDGSEDRRWIGNLLYFNPEDPAVFVEKRSGLGYTINFGRPMGWAILGAILMATAAAFWL